MRNARGQIGSSNCKTVSAEEWHKELLLSVLIRTSIQIQKTLDRSFSRFGITAQEAAVLVRCVESRETHAGRLALALGRDKGKITRFVDRLVAKNLISREVSSRDRRLYIIKATSRGRRIAKPLSGVFEDCRSKLLKGVIASDIRRVATVLLRMNANTNQLRSMSQGSKKGRGKAVVVIEAVGNDFEIVPPGD